jgi:ABC-type transport system involved in multi-copper enzyme maturation permease subunit
MLNVYRRLAARHAVFILICTFLLAGFEFAICALLSTFDISGALGGLRKSAPPFMQSLLGEQFFGELTSRGMMAFAWNHPIALSLGGAIAIVLASRAVAGEIESGTLELILGQPISRIAYLGAQVGFAFSALALLSFGGMVGTIAGQRLYELRAFDLRSLLEISLNFFLLQCVWFGFTLVISAFGREGGKVAGAAFLLALVSYFVEVIGKLAPTVAPLMPYSPYDYYSPFAILVESKPVAGSLAALIAMLAISLGFVAWRFERRDIP